ncbi:hypothetical protein OG976_10550 [Mycobacterium sp. NBC_00419]|uniref:2-keto-4-pentenoate hydratase n=1 Tax=Mycobacterium sp. NBC_00419 TaxID=2975989 RepID=UPI002E1EB422
MDTDQIAAAILSARARRQPLPPITDSFSMTMRQAYEVQAAVTAHRIAAGQKVIGWKLGYTSRAMREQMGISEMNFGPLTDSMLLANNSQVPATTVQPMVEPEIAVVLSDAPVPPFTPDAVRAVIKSAHSCLEIVDPIWAGRRFRIEDNTADGSSAAFFVLGGEIATRDLPAVEVRLAHDDSFVAAATGEAADGDPSGGIAWLAYQLAALGESLRGGDIVLTGGLTRAVPIDPGHRVSAVFRHDGHTSAVMVRR